MSTAEALRAPAGAINNSELSMIGRICLVLGCFIAFSAGAITGGSVDPALRGEWVPAKAACGSALKVVVESNKVTFFNGPQQQAYTKLDQCFSCAGRDVQNVVWLSTDAMGDSPFIIHFDTKKRVATEVDFSNDKKLAARFPLKGPLKRCG